MKTIDFNGHEIVYDETVIDKWSWQHRVTGACGVTELYRAMDELFGACDAVAQEIGDSTEAMGELLQKIAEENGDPKASVPSRQRFKVTGRS